MSEQFTCERCGGEYPIDDCHLFDDQALCPDCYEENTVICECCGNRIWRDDNAGTDDTVLCQHCYDNHYTSCTHCDCLIHNDNAYYEDDEDDPYCQDCFERYSDDVIHSYSYKPEPIFYGEGRRFYGIELELDCGGKRTDHARKLLDIANAKGELLYIKTDGSLDDGMELVTHPMTRSFHENNMPWADVLHKALDLGYVSHKASTCGLHIHVGRKEIGSDEAEQEICISKIMFFIERFWQEMLRFSRRTEYQIQRWAARYGYKDKPKDILEHAKKGYGNRYTCININNPDTIEFRIFRGTLKYNTLIATLQMVDHICDVAFLFPESELAELSWPAFVGGIDTEKNAALITYLKERRLYVNDPIEVCEEEQ